MLWFPYKHLEYLCCRWLLLVAGGVGRGDIYVLIRLRSFDETDGGRKSLTFVVSTKHPREWLRSGP